MLIALDTVAGTFTVLTCPTVCAPANADRQFTIDMQKTAESQKRKFLIQILYRLGGVAFLISSREVAAVFPKWMWFA